MSQAPIIYAPQGPAAEYAALGLNLYNGCTHFCRYCYNVTMPWTNPENYYLDAQPTPDVLARLERDARKLAATKSPPEILMSFRGDVYQPQEAELKLTRRAIQILIRYKLPFTILTKGTNLARRDFDLLRGYGRARFGVSLSFFNELTRRKWEVNGDSVDDRLEVLSVAHGMGIPTWVSLEPVIDPQEALTLIGLCRGVVDFWWIGKLNHHPEIEKTVDWPRFVAQVESLLRGRGCRYRLKKSLAAYANGDGHAR